MKLSLVIVIETFYNFQLENYTESEFRILCDHLGHSLDVHKRFYRLRETTVEFTKIGKMLANSLPTPNESAINLNAPTRGQATSKTSVKR